MNSRGGPPLGGCRSLNYRIGPPHPILRWGRPPGIISMDLAVCLLIISFDKAGLKFYFETTQI